MPKHCPTCGSTNPDDGFWCVHCNQKLTDSITINTKRPEDTRYASRTIFISGGLDTNMEPSYHHGKSVYGFTLGAIIGIAVIIAYCTISIDVDFSGINCKINNDFWFEGSYLNTSDGWSFTMNKVKDYTLNGIVLGLKTYTKNDYPYRPINIFSPIDLVIGIDDVAEHPEKYPFSIRYEYRGYWCTINGLTIVESEYMKTHMGNNHIIPHNQLVLNQLKNISINDYVVIEGSLVNLYGSRGGEQYYWTTDTQIGNYNCEIILVDNLIIE
jgi:hypothetical protein